MYAREKALKTIQKYKTRDPFQICKERHIEIIFSDLEDDVKGIYQYYKRKQIIHLNSHLPLIEQRGVLAHELGHVDMHQGYNCIFLARYTYLTKDKYERQANIYAAELLFPDYNMIPFEYRNYSYQQIASLYRAPIELVKLKYKLC